MCHVVSHDDVAATRGCLVSPARYTYIYNNFIQTQICLQSTSHAGEIYKIMTRADQTARSIAKAIAPHNGRKKWSLASILSAFAALFSLFRLRFERFRNDLFHTLRTEVWQIDEDSYESSFGDGDGLELLQGNMGYSGSVRSYHVRSSAILVKLLTNKVDILQHEG